MYLNKPDQVEFIGEAETEKQAIEVFRTYLLEHNKRLLTHKDLPEVIANLAKASIERNANLDIVVTKDGSLTIDGVGQEMDYYTIIPNKR